VAFYTYILASRRNGTIYIGSTDDLIKRMGQHREKTFQGFTAKYGVDRLVWYEVHDGRETAFRRERQLKKWNRTWTGWTSTTPLDGATSRTPPTGSHP
jgi:putative endonuclease